MDDRKVLAAILIMGVSAIAIPLIELAQHLLRHWRWQVDQEPFVDTQTNGGVKAR